jgi:hypothetical protein
LLSDAEVLDDALPKIEGLVQQKWRAFPELRLLIITPTHWLRVYDGNLNGHREVFGESFLERLSGRGDILDYFSKVESLVREIIQARILGLFLFSTTVDEFDQILQRVGFYNCIRLLVDWKMIGKNLKDKIDEVNKVRNQLAHSWSEHDVYYKKNAENKSIRLFDNINEFRKDAKVVWLELIKIYMQAEVKDIGRLISRLEDPNTINVWSDIHKESF